MSAVVQAALFAADWEGECMNLEMLCHTLVLPVNLWKEVEPGSRSPSPRVSENSGSQGYDVNHRDGPVFNRGFNPA